jgi:hypothetical protein
VNKEYKESGALKVNREHKGSGVFKECRAYPARVQVPQPASFDTYHARES